MVSDSMKRVVYKDGRNQSHGVLGSNASAHRTAAAARAAGSRRRSGSGWYFYAGGARLRREGAPIAGLLAAVAARGRRSSARAATARARYEALEPLRGVDVAPMAACRSDGVVLGGDRKPRPPTCRRRGWRRGPQRQGRRRRPVSAAGRRRARPPRRRYQGPNWQRAPRRPPPAPCAFDPRGVGAQRGRRGRGSKSGAARAPWRPERRRRPRGSRRPARTPEPLGKTSLRLSARASHVLYAEAGTRQVARRRRRRVLVGHPAGRLEDAAGGAPPASPQASWRCPGRRRSATPCRASRRNGWVPRRRPRRGVSRPCRDRRRPSGRAARRAIEDGASQARVAEDHARPRRRAVRASASHQAARRACLNQIDEADRRVESAIGKRPSPLLMLVVALAAP